MGPDISPYDAVIADLEAKREQIGGMIENLKAIKSMVGSVSFPGVNGNTSKPISPNDIPHDAFFNMTILDAARKYLGIVKRTKPLPDLCDALLAGGLKTSATNFRDTVRAGLSRQADFVRINGEWGLSEWYPGRKRQERKMDIRSHAPVEDDSGSTDSSEPEQPSSQSQNGV